MQARNGGSTYQVDDAVKMFEAALFQDARVHIVFEMPVVERDPDAVQAERGKEVGVRFREEI
jgi:hypothetical protein